MIKHKKILNIFTYDYPSYGNDHIFISDEVDFFSKKFYKINIIPIKKTNKKINYNNNNIFTDYSLIKEIFNIKKILIKILRIFLCKYFWLEIISLKYKNYFKKIKMIIIDRFLAESIYFYIKNKKQNDNDLYYSFWSNHTLIGFFFLKKERIINTCFSRILGSDLKGFIPNDKYVSFKNIKFRSLNTVLTLNDEQKRILVKDKLINKKKIKKNYLGINKSNELKLNFINKKKIIFASCGRFEYVKNTIEIIKFISTFSNINKLYEIEYYCIGDGPDKMVLLNYVKNNFSKKINFKLVKYVPSLTSFLIKKKVNFFLNFSYSEGMSFAVMEALSCSIPIIGSNIPGNNEIINSKNGYLLKKLNLKEYTLTAKKILEDILNKNYIKKQINSYKVSNEKISRKRNLLELDKILNNIILK